VRFLLLVLIFAASATAALAAPVADRKSSARLLACDTEARAASFKGDMKAFGRALNLSMRFTLKVRDLANPVFRRVEAPSFDEWLPAEQGTKRFVFEKAVENLPPGADYRAVVRFRWRGPKDKILARATDVTRACRQPDTRADLEPTRISVSGGSRDETRFYSVRVVNSGLADAPAFATRLDVSGAAVEESTGEPLAPGEADTLLFEAPRCAPGSQITATVDAGATVDEADEADNVLTMECPNS